MKKFKSLFCLSFVLVMMFFAFSLSKGNIAVNANSIDYDIVEEGEGSNDNEYFDGSSGEETISETHQIGNGSVGGDDPDPNANTALGIGNGSVGGDDPDPNANTALGIGNGSVGGDDPDPNANTALGGGENDNSDK